MDDERLNRRDLLKAGSSLGAISLAGCSGIPDKEPSLDLPNLGGTEEQSNTKKKQTDSQPEPTPVDEYTLPKENTVNEWHGTLALNEEQPHWAQKITPPEPNGNSLRYGECYVLECEVNAPSAISFDDEEVNLFLIPSDEKSRLEEAAKVEICHEVAGQEVCRTNHDYYSRSGVSGKVIELQPDETVYTRYLLSNEDFHLVIDGSDAVGGELTGVDPTRDIADVDLETKIRVVNPSSEEARSEALRGFRNWSSGIPKESAEETMSEAQEFAQEICSITGIEEMRNAPVDELTADADQARQYGELIEKVLGTINDRYSTEFPESFVERLNKMLRWGSTVVPILASAASVAENACQLANTDLDSSDEELARQVETFLSSIAGLAVEIIFLKLGIASRVSRSVIRSADAFALGYLREIAGLRLFAYVVRNIVIEIEQGLFQTVHDFAEHIIDEIGDFITESDLDLLERLSDDDNTWEDMAFLDEGDCDCDSLNYTEVCHKSVSA